MSEDVGIPLMQNLIALISPAASSIAVASTGTAWSYSFELERNCDYSLELQFTSSGGVDVKVELEQANSAPDTEAASDTDYVISDGASELSSGITDELVHFLAVSPVVSKRARIKFTGQGSNHASTVVSRLRFNYAKKD